MVILVGGSSHVGKTLVAQKLVEKYKFPCTSLDHLKMAFIRTGRTDLTVCDDYRMRFFLWPFAAEMIKTAIENNQNMIIEGCYIPKSWKESFSDDYLKQVRPVFILMSENYLRKNIDDVSRYADVIEKRIDDFVDLDRLINCSKEFKDDCLSNGTPYIEIDGKYDLEKLVEDVCLVVEKNRMNEF